MRVQPKSRAEMDAVHHAARVRRAQRAAASSPAGSAAAPQRRNLQPILELGETTYFQFRGRAYGVPPLPWRLGQRIMDAYLRAIASAAALANRPTDEDERRRYYAAIAELPPLLWGHTFVTEIRWRLMRRLRLLRNPFQRASEGEVLELADFFLQRRTRLSGPPRPALTDPRILRSRSTSLTTS